MTTLSAPQQAERRRRRALLVAGRVADGRAKFAPPSASGRSRLVPSIRRHRAASGGFGRGVGHGGGNLPEPCDLGFRTWRAMNGVADSAAPLRPGLSVTVGENFPHRATRRFAPAACGDRGCDAGTPVRPGVLPNSAAKFAEPFRGQRGWKISAPVATADGGGNLAPPCDLGFYRSAPLTVPPR